jgi:hypothetical protein
MNLRAVGNRATSSPVPNAAPWVSLMKVAEQARMIPQTADRGRVHHEPVSDHNSQP